MVVLPLKIPIVSPGKAHCDRQGHPDRPDKPVNVKAVHSEYSKLRWTCGTSIGTSRRGGSLLPQKKKKKEKRKEKKSVTRSYDFFPYKYSLFDCLRRGKWAGLA